MMATQIDLEYFMLIANIGSRFTIWIEVSRWNVIRVSIEDCGLGIGDLD